MKRVTHLPESARWLTTTDGREEDGRKAHSTALGTFPGKQIMMEGGVKKEGRPGQSVLPPLRSFNFRVARGGEPNCESRIRTAGQERQSRAGAPVIKRRPEPGFSSLETMLPGRPAFGLPGLAGTNGWNERHRAPFVSCVHPTPCSAVVQYWMAVSQRRCERRAADCVSYRWGT